MTELIICAIIIILTFAISMHRSLNQSDDRSQAAYYDCWWWILPM
jgi:hypothetical protein